MRKPPAQDPAPSSAGREIPVPETVAATPLATLPEPMPTKVEPLPPESLPEERGPSSLPEQTPLPGVVMPPPTPDIPPEPLIDPMSFPPEPVISIEPPGVTEPTAPPVPDIPPPVSYQPAPAPVVPKTFGLDAPPAVLALEEDVQKKMNTGNYGDAATTLERAIRIQPKNPELWHVLAKIRLKQRQPGLAQDLARKSNLLAKNNAELVRANWDIIAQALRAKGDLSGAAEAQRKAGW